MLKEPLKLPYFSTYKRAQENMNELGAIMRRNLAPRIEKFGEADPNTRIRLALELYEDAKDRDGEVADFTSLFYLTSLMPNLEEVEIAEDIKESHKDGIPISKMSIEEFLDRFCNPPRLSELKIPGIEHLMEVDILHQVELDKLKELVGPIVGEMVKAYELTDTMVDKIEEELKERK